MDEIELDNIDTRLKTTTGTNTNPFSQVGIINKETKKKPYDVKIKNNNPNEPKVNINMKYSDKQKYRRYKTKTEPKLFSKIMIDEEDDIVNTIKKAFGMENKKNTNMTNVETSGVPYYEEPNPVEGEEPNIVEMVRETAPAQEEELQRAAPPAARRVKTPASSAMRTPAKSIATELTGEEAQPEPLSPGQIIAINYLKTLEEKKRKKAQEEAEERAKKEKERLFELSKIAKEESEKARNLLDKPLTAKEETLFSQNLLKFKKLTEIEKELLKKQYIRTRFLPDLEYIGKTPEDRIKSGFTLQSQIYERQDTAQK